MYKKHSIDRAYLLFEGAILKSGSAEDLAQMNRLEKYT